jgi:predicted aspartyl protease
VKRWLPLVAVALLTGCGASAAAEKPQGELHVKIRLMKDGDHVLALVPVTINGKGPWAFALDTGASQSVVDSQVAAELSVKVTGKKQRIAGVTSVTKVRSIKVREWRVGNVSLPATTVVEANLPFGNAHGGVQGLLGSDMLSQFDVVTIDYAHSMLVLRHRASD